MDGWMDGWVHVWTCFALVLVVFSCLAMKVVVSENARFSFTLRGAAGSCHMLDHVWYDAARVQCQARDASSFRKTSTAQDLDGVRMDGRTHLQKSGRLLNVNCHAVMGSRIGAHSLCLVPIRTRRVCVRVCVCADVQLVRWLLV